MSRPYRFIAPPRLPKPFKRTDFPDVYAEFALDNFSKARESGFLFNHFLRDAKDVWRAAEKDLLAAWMAMEKFGIRPMSFWQAYGPRPYNKYGRMMSQYQWLAEHNSLLPIERERVERGLPLDPAAMREYTRPPSPFFPEGDW